MADAPLKNENLELTGRLITSVDGTQLGKGDFQELSNMRYTNTGIRAITGISKINTSPVTEPVPGAALHFVKDFPAESHLLYQGVAANGSTSSIYDHTTAIPSQGGFTSIKSLSGTTKGKFLTVPDGSVVFGNDSQVLIWGGNENRCAGFLVANTDESVTPTKIWDYTDDMTDGDATTTASLLGGCIHIASTKRLNGIKFYVSTPNSTFLSTASVYYWDGLALASVTNLVDGTTVGGYPLAQTGVISFDSTDSVARVRYLNNTVAYWYMVVFNSANIVTNGTFTSNITGWSGTNWAWNSGDGGKALHTSGSTAAFTQAAATVVDGTTYKVQYDIIGQTTGSVTVSVGGVTGTTRTVNDTNITEYFTATATTALAFTPSSAFDGAIDNVYLTAISNPAIVSKCAVSAAWQAPSDLWDGAERQIASFQSYKLSTAEYQDYSTRVFSQDYVAGAVTTYMSFNSGLIDLVVGFTERMTAIKFYIIPEHVNTTSNDLGVSYWNGDVWASVDLTDGTEENGKSFRKTGVVSWNAPDSAIERRLAINTPDPLYYYKVNLGTDVDAGFTPTSMALLALQGYYLWVVTKAGHGLATGDRVRISGGSPKGVNLKIVRVVVTSSSTFWYYNAYPSGPTVTVLPLIQKYDPSTTLGANIYVDYVTGIPAIKTIGQYKFPTTFQNRLVLCNNQGSESNSALIGASNTNCVFNGADTTKVFFGDDRGLTAAASFFSRFSNNYFENLIAFKPDSVWVVDGQSADTFKTFKLSSIHGCSAPATLTSCDIGFDSVPGSTATRNILLWQAANAICIFEGSSVIPVHFDIEDVFDQTKSYAIEPTMVNKSSAFFDEVNREWHWLWASKGNTTLNMEYVFDVIRKKWYTVDRGTGNRLQLGVSVMDTNNNRYTYGVTSDGYFKRLENGKTFDGTDITAYYKTGDVPLTGWGHTSSIRFIKPIMKSKNVTVNKMSLTYYGDGSNSALATMPFSVADGTHRIKQTPESISKGDFTFHSLKCSMTTNDEDICFEPVGISIFYKEKREDLNRG